MKISRPFPAKYAGTCVRCGKTFRRGAMIQIADFPRPKSKFHADCSPGSEEDLKVEAPVEGGEDKDLVETAEAPSLDAAIDARIDARIKDGGLGVDEATVKKLLEDLAPRKVEVEIKRPDGQIFKTEGEHYLFPRLVKLLGAGLHIYLWGPAGSGKTTAAVNAARALGREGEIDTLDPSTPKSSVLGYRTPVGEPVETAFTRQYAKGGIYIADEADNAPAHVQTLFNSALANGHAPAAWGLIPRHETFGFVGTGNTPGRPTPKFPDRRPMSAAFGDRLYFIHWPLDPAIECRAAGLPCPKVPERVEATAEPKDWVRWVQRARAWVTDNAPTLMVTPRASLIGIQALALGETPREVADGLIFRGADEALVSKVLDAVPLP